MTTAPTPLKTATSAIEASLLEKASASKVKTLALLPEGVCLLDQTRIPQVVQYVTITTPQAMVAAIQTMIVRGAPAIGIAGAYGVVLSARVHALQKALSLEIFKSRVKEDALVLRQARPTAVNLMWAIDALLPLIEKGQSAQAIVDALSQKALQIHQDDLAACVAMGEYGAGLVETLGVGILTHCNAGALATAGYGTALGVVRSVFARDNTIQVYADETRPRLQGGRLTTWELLEDGIPVTLICDNMAATLMRDKKVDLVLVGADRIAANGDTANKIGTYNLALISKAHQVPFYVVAPLTTFDMSIETGADIPIEHRDPFEVTGQGEGRICPDGVGVYNPAFDVTPAELITAIITEKGVARPDYRQSLSAFFK